MRPHHGDTQPFSVVTVKVGLDMWFLFRKQIYILSVTFWRFACDSAPTVKLLGGVYKHLPLGLYFNLMIL